MKKLIIFIAIALLVLIGSFTFLIYGTKVEREHIIKTDEISATEFLKILNESDMFQKAWWIACRWENVSSITCGEYTIPAGLNAFELIQLLKKGDQSSYMIRTDKKRIIDGFFDALAEKLKYTASEYRDGFCKTLGLDTSANGRAMATTYLFANTFDFQYSDTPERVAKRFKKMHDDFWTNENLEKAKAMNLSPEQVYILASIIKGECKHEEEAPKIAGLYMNRINQKMLLQCDATVQFIVSRKNARRILNADLEIDSPYNTYKYPGLPPGPIHIAEKKFLAAVLNFEHHDGIYMCAKDDGSGYHHFTSSLQEHNRNASAYQAYLRKLNIKN